MMKFGIDVSHWQGNYNFAKAKAEGAEFVIIKAGGADAGLYQDSKFESYYNAARSAGFNIGAYFYGNAFSEADARKEADKFISIISGKKFEYPVYYDVEGKMIGQSKESLTKAVAAFCKRMEAAGYFAGIYSSESFFNSNMDDAALKAYAHWVAKYSPNTPKLKSGNGYGMWQFGGEKNYVRSNRMAGVVTDQNYCYEDYPAAIRRLGKNGYTATTATVAPTQATTPTPAAQPARTVPAYKVGQTYKLLDEMRVRTSPKIAKNNIKSHADLTANAKAHDKDKDGALDKGTPVTCQGTAEGSGYLWMKIPSGYVAAYNLNTGKQYIG